MAEQIRNAPGAHTQDVEPPAYERAVLIAPESQAGNQAPPPASEPLPGYVKRTPSQEQLYLERLKAWAVEKEKMFPGAYGEYFGKVDPDRVPYERFYDDWHKQGGRVANGGAMPSQAERDARTLAEIEEMNARRHTYGLPAVVQSEGRILCPISYMKSEEPAASSDSPREGFMKRKMSSFMNKIGRRNSADVARDEEQESSIHPHSRLEDDGVVETISEQPKQ